MSDTVPPVRSARTSVMLRAFVFQDGAREGSEHRVVNVSATGLGLAQPIGLLVGMVVAVSIGQVEHAAAEVVWVRAGQAGLRFRQPIDLARARLRRAGTGTAPPPAAGWLTAIDDPYRRDMHN